MIFEGFSSFQFAKQQQSLAPHRQMLRNFQETMLHFHVNCLVLRLQEMMSNFIWYETEKWNSNVSLFIKYAGLILFIVLFVTDMEHRWQQACYGKFAEPNV